MNCNKAALICFPTFVVLQLDPTNEAAKENIQVCSILPQLMLLFVQDQTYQPCLQSGSSNTKKFPMPEIRESREDHGVTISKLTYDLQ